MKPRDFLNFFKTKTGKLIVFAALFGAGLIIFSVIRQRHTAIDIITAPLMTNSVTAQPEVIQTVVRPMQVFHPPPPRHVVSGWVTVFGQRMGNTFPAICLGKRRVRRNSDGDLSRSISVIKP
ncbi:MAG TPA: hypothetical protein VMH87_17045, partial [Pseudomonadales bacterium]|nr:hypothetical protein [Pseudomonadales bacterium]